MTWEIILEFGTQSLHSGVKNPKLSIHPGFPQQLSFTKMFTSRPNIHSDNVKLISFAFVFLRKLLLVSVKVYF